MLAELETYQDQLLSIRQDASGLLSGFSDHQFNWRPAPNRWSMGECFDHLNLTAARLFLPAIDAAIDGARRQGLTSPGPFAYPALQRMFLKISEPPPKVRFKAPSAIKQQAARPMAVVRQEFMERQDRLAAQILRADGLDLRRARQRSPLPIWKWSLGTFFAVALAHERRHIWQARQVCNEREFPTN